MATKNKEKEAAAAQAAQTAGRQAAQEAPAAVAGAPAEAAPAKGKEEKKPEPAASVLEKAGMAAVARHGLKEVFVTSDGQAFPLSSDAKSHASGLPNKEIIKVKKQ